MQKRGAYIIRGFFEAVHSNSSVITLHWIKRLLRIRSLQSLTITPHFSLLTQGRHGFIRGWPKYDRQAYILYIPNQPFQNLGLVISVSRAQRIKATFFSDPPNWVTFFSGLWFEPKIKAYLPVSDKLVCSFSSHGCGF